jgi:hypothetical protein
MIVALCMTQVQGDFDLLRSVDKGQMSIDSQSADSSVWIVTFERETGPTSFYAYERQRRKFTFLFMSRGYLEQHKLSLMRGVVVKARDGMSIPCYFAFPPVEVGPLLNRIGVKIAVLPQLT